MPQLYGFLSKMYSLGKKEKDFDIIFLNSRITPPEKIKIKAKKILNNIYKYNYVITFDDAAFKYVGIPASKKGIPVIFSGLNYPFEKYKKEYNLSNNISGVYEKFYTKEILSAFNKIYPIKKIAILYSKGIGEIGTKQILNEIKDSIFEKKVVLIFVKNLEDLKEKCKLVNQNDDFSIFIPQTLSLKEKNKKIPFYKLKDIYLKYIKKPDYSINISFAALGFLGFGGENYFKMGQQAAEIFIKFAKTKKPVIENAKEYYFFFNYNRAREINFKYPQWFLKDNIKEIIW
jgi:ABC-type uncharacterized transport system substrate-binding protein